MTDKRRRGAPAGNRNAWKNGRHSAAAKAARQAVRSSPLRVEDFQLLRLEDLIGRK